MRKARSTAMVAAVAFAATAAWPAAAEQPGPGIGNNPVYRHLVARTMGLHTSVADIEVRTQLKSFPPASFTFHGHSYYQAPDRQSVVFDDVPRMLRGMFKDSPTISPAPVWTKVYDTSVLGDDGTSTTFRLVPKDPESAIDHADVTVDDTTALVSRFAFVNKNGSTVTTDNAYEKVGRYELVSSQTGEAVGHGYHAVVRSTFSNYRLNEPLPDEAFEPK